MTLCAVVMVACLHYVEGPQPHHALLALDRAGHARREHHLSPLKLRVTASPMESPSLLAPAARCRPRPRPRGRRLWAGVLLRQDVLQYAFAVFASSFGQTIHQSPCQRVEEEDREVRTRVGLRRRLIQSARPVGVFVGPASKRRSR